MGKNKKKAVSSTIINEDSPRPLKPPAPSPFVVVSPPIAAASPPIAAASPPNTTELPTEIMATIGNTQWKVGVKKTGGKRRTRKRSTRKRSTRKRKTRKRSKH